MTSPIGAPAIGALGSVPFQVPTAVTSPAAPAASSSFPAALGKGIDAVAAAQSQADGLAVQAATGQLTDISSYTVAAGKAQVMTEFASALRTKAVDAFNTVMGMQA